MMDEIYWVSVVIVELCNDVSTLKHGAIIKVLDGIAEVHASCPRTSLLSKRENANLF